METKIKKIVISSLFAAVLFFGAAGPIAAQYQNQAELSVRIAEIKRQILILQIQLIQMRIADLQQQLAQLNANTVNNANRYIDVIYPNGGEKLENRHSYYIRWESRGVDRVTIELENSGNGMIIANNVLASDGRYYWNAGNISGSEYRIHIFNPDKPSVSDISSVKFSIFDNSGGNHCSDGTIVGKCSADQPKLCFDTDLDLVDACHSCGCPSGSSCGSDSNCH